MRKISVEIHRPVGTLKPVPSFRYRYNTVAADRWHCTHTPTNVFCMEIFNQIYTVTVYRLQRYNLRLDEISWKFIREVPANLSLCVCSHWTRSIGYSIKKINRFERICLNFNRSMFHTSSSRSSYIGLPIYYIVWTISKRTWFM